MKLTESSVKIESSGDMEEKFFSIQDQGMIFDILRNKMYSDPILAICREISCNARDAHREIGNKDSIQITLPNAINPFYKIKDFGPGISPSRMENVFIQYTASTKRNDNVQTGGFGLGAKTPFSYSDTFTITTVVDKVKYNYACFIDETKVGKLLLMSKEECDEPNSTEINIPVKEQDFNRFFVATEECTRHWDVKPIIKGGNIKWKTFSSKLEGNSWKIASLVESNDNYIYGYGHNNSYSNQTGIKIIIDGIEYLISKEAVQKFADTSLIDCCRGYMFLYFNIGELSLAANRESVYIDKATESKIKDRLELVKKEILGIINDNISKLPSYLEANHFYVKDLRNLFNDIDFFGPLKWNGITLYGSSVNLMVPVMEFYRSKVLRGKSHGEETIRSKTSHYVMLSNNTALYFNDCNLTNITYKHVKKAFENKDIQSVQIISPNKNQSFADLDKQWSLTGLGFNMLSDIAAGIPNTAKKPSTNKLLVFRIYTGYGNNAIGQVPYSSIEEDENKEKVLLFFEKSGNIGGYDKKFILSNGKNLYVDALPTLALANPNVSFYAIDKNTPEDRIKKEFADFISLDKFIEDKIEPTFKECVKIKSITSIGVASYINPGHFSKLKNLVTDQNSPFLKRINILEATEEASKLRNKVTVYETFVNRISELEIKSWLKNNPDYDFDKYNKLCTSKYILLNAHYLHHVNPEHIALYVNFIDSI